MEEWIIDEFGKVACGDHRLNLRCMAIANSMNKNPASKIYSSQRNPSEAKAAYRFFSNNRVSEAQLFHSHKERLASSLGSLEPAVFLNIQDTTTLDFTNMKSCKGLLPTSRNQNHTKSMKGFFLHQSLLCTNEGIPLGIPEYQFFGNSKKAKTLGSHKDLPLEEKKSFRWLVGARSTKELCETHRVVHICDREADIYELLQVIVDQGDDFVIRLQNNRILKESTRKNTVKILDKLSQMDSLGKVEIEIPKGRHNKVRKFQGDVYSATVNLKKIYRLPSAISQFELRDITINVVCVDGKLDGKVTKWYLITSLPVSRIKECLEVISYYQKRWLVEEYFKILKAALKVEDCRLEQADRLKKYILFAMIIARRFFYLAMLNKITPTLKASLILSRDQLIFLQKLIANKINSVKDVIIAISKLGGYLNRKNDRPPGVLVLVRGWKRFSDAYFLGYSVATESYG